PHIGRRGDADAPFASPCAHCRETKRKSMSSIVHFIHDGGFVMYPLLALSLAAIAVIVERLIAYRQMGYLAPGLLATVVKLCQDGRFDQALQACKARRGPKAACLAVAVEHRNQPIREVERMVEETGQHYFIR